MIPAPDGREGGIPDPATAGPDWIQIGTEGGFLPAPVVVPSQPVTWNGDPTLFNFGNVKDHSLLLGTAERADVIVDFSQYAGKTLILYNDAPTAFPANIPQYDYYTGAPDRTDIGGAPTIQAGYGPNVRTVMQIRVSGGAGGLEVSNVNLAAGGAGYTAPTVDIVGGNPITNATATATGSVDRISLNTLGRIHVRSPWTSRAAAARAPALRDRDRRRGNRHHAPERGLRLHFSSNSHHHRRRRHTDATARATLTITGTSLRPGRLHSPYPSSPFRPGRHGRRRPATASLFDPTHTAYD
jgi:hypothetical protein